MLGLRRSSRGNLVLETDRGLPEAEDDGDARGVVAEDTGNDPESALLFLRRSRCMQARARCMDFIHKWSPSGPAPIRDKDDVRSLAIPELCPELLRNLGHRP